MTGTASFEIRNPDGSTAVVDTFTAETFDGAPFTLTVATGQACATLCVPGIIRNRVTATLPRDKAFRIWHTVSVLTLEEVRGMANFS